MNFELTDDQKMIKDSVADFAQKNILPNRMIWDEAQIFPRELFSEMGKIGLMGMLVPEEYGGSNFGLAGISVILQECGKTLTPSPLFATGVLGAYAISQYGTEDQKKKYLPQIANGEITTAIAIDESSHHNPLNINTSAVSKDNNYILNGKKVFVVDGASADLLIVVTRTSGKTGDSTGLTLFLVENNQPSINVVKLDMADSRNYANITFSDISVQKENILGDVEAGGEAIENILDIGRIAISAEMLGNTEAAFESTINYLKERKQFGVLIGTFQALQHRAAEMFCEIELTKSSIMAAMQGADNNSNELQRLASLAKTMAGETLHLVSNEAIQMHGGIGVTDEYDLGFYLKRSRVVEQIFGCSKFHTERYANISGF